MLGFVDDTRKFNNINTKGSITENVSFDLMKWKKMSQIIAGKLNIEKCGYYTLQWEYNKKGCLAMMNTDNEDVYIQDETTNTRQIVKKFKNNQAYKYLGITTAPDWNTYDSKASITKICQQFA